MGGTNDSSNLVELTPEEHFVAHQLLVKIYPGIRSLTFALIIMSGKGKGQELRNNKLFGWHRRKHATATSQMNKGSNNGMYGHVYSEEERQKLRGRIPWNKNITGCEATNGSFEKGHVPWNDGIKTGPQSEEQKKNTSKGMLESQRKRRENPDHIRNKTIKIYLRHAGDREKVMKDLMEDLSMTREKAKGHYHRTKKIVDRDKIST
jgi:hypothetical protein